MHGQIKVRTTAEQQEAKKKEQARKLAAFNHAMKRIFTKRASEEKDHEQLSLTTSVLQANPDISTLWNIRREVLLKFQTQLSSEDFDSLLIEDLKLIERCLPVNPKSYSSWHHRTWVLGKMAQPRWDLELKLCNAALDLDERNFHSWDYRRFVTSKAGILTDKELEFSTKKVSGNLSNYSAWHYRSELLPRAHPSDENALRPSSDAIENELKLVQKAIFTDPWDQSAFFYHRWLLGRKERKLGLSHVQCFFDNGVIFSTLSTSVPCKNTAIKLSINGVSMESVISPFGEYGTIWTSQGYGFQLPCIVNASVNSEFETIKVEKEGVWYKSSECFDPGEEADVDVEILKKELESLEMLRKLEPDNKWVLLTSFHVLRCLCHEVQDDLMLIIQKLREIDSSRAHFYDDLNSKVVIEEVISRNHFGHAFICSDRALTGIHHVSYLAFIQEIDFSRNQLTDMKFAKYLVCTKKLNLSRNYIKLLCDISSQLEELDLSHNSIRNIDKFCVQNLKILKIGGNPFDFTQLKRDLPSSLHVE